MKNEEKLIKARALYLASIEAEDYAKALHKNEFYHPCLLGLRAKALISMPEKAFNRKIDAASIAERLGQELAHNIESWDDETINFQIERIQDFSFTAKSGLVNNSPEKRTEKARILLEIRSAKRQWKQGRTLAFNIVDDIGVDRFTAFGSIALAI